jgi:hypothetical protein
MAEIDRSLRFCCSLHERPSGVVGGDATAFGTLGERAADLRGGP